MMKIFMPAVVLTMALPFEVHAYGAAHAGYTHVGPGGVTHVGRTAVGGYGGYRGGYGYGGYRAGYGYGYGAYRGGYGYGAYNPYAYGTGVYTPPVVYPPVYPYSPYYYYGAPGYSYVP